MHLEPFGRVTKLGAKRAELVQKFVPRYCIGIFLNESTGSTPLDLKSCFEEFRTIWVHWDRLVALRNSVQNGLN